MSVWMFGWVLVRYKAEMGWVLVRYKAEMGLRLMWVQCWPTFSPTQFFQPVIVDESSWGGSCRESREEFGQSGSKMDAPHLRIFPFSPCPVWVFLVALHRPASTLSPLPVTVVGHLAGALIHGPYCVFSPGSINSSSYLVAQCCAIWSNLPQM
ncbi:hypothetical protein Salat_0203700 [Sesamum alatum]|uniref:Uncharacterized protein n=1 Tax=Sesamum alatum TaxID=300844 RepID=A0AAE2CXZ2_9LAMI|nr:hypothetical protein Salat_0203700 [Sesamum alatum]